MAVCYLPSTFFPLFFILKPIGKFVVTVKVQTKTFTFGQRIGILICGSLLICGLSVAGADEPAEVNSVELIERAVQKTIAKNEKSVVSIARVKKLPTQADLSEDDDLRFLVPGRLPRRFDPDHPDFVPNDFGSGVIVDRAGLIVTNYHVLGEIEKSQYWVWVGRRPFQAQVKAADPWLDLAVLKIAAENLEPITFGDPKLVKKGQFVVALGNPFALARDGQPSAAWGIVANVARKVPPSRESSRGLTARDTLHHFGTLIQTDLRLPVGTSGGALLNLQGEMIGLTTSLAAQDGSESQAGFAIPVDETFRRVLENLKAGRKAEYGFLGVAPELLPLEQRQRGIAGVRIAQIVPGTPAAISGLTIGDIITRVNGVDVFDDTELIRELSKLPVEAEVELQMERPGARLPNARSFSKTVKLSKKYLGGGGSRSEFSEQAIPSWRGLSIEYSTAIPNFSLRANEVDPQGCVAVLEVEKDSPAWSVGLRSGIFVSHVDGQRVSSPQEFFDAVKNRNDAVVVRLTAAIGAAATRTIPAP